MRRWCDRFPLVKCGRPIDTHRFRRVTQALLKHPRRIISRHIPLASHDVIDMLAHCRCIYRRLASAEAELINSHKIRPLVNLLQRAECAREHETADRIAVAICTVGVEFAASVTGRNVDAREIANACDLNVVWSDHDMRTSNGAVWDESCSVSTLHAPCYFDLLGVPDDRVRAWLRRRPDTPILNIVDISILALRRLIVASSAVVVACLPLLALIGSV